MEVAITVDLEHDCPPFLTTYRGVTQGMPRLLELLAAEQVPATFFCTGDVARKHPENRAPARRRRARARLPRRYACALRRDGSRDGGARAARCRRDLARLRLRRDLVSRAQPRLPGRVRAAPRRARLPARLVTGQTQARLVLRAAFLRCRPGGGIERVPATIAPSAVRLPKLVRQALFARMRDPVVFFFHPWEFVDVTREPIPLDCRFATGEPALASLRATIAWSGGAGRRSAGCASSRTTPREEQRKERRQHHQARFGQLLGADDDGARVAVERDRQRVIHCHTNNEDSGRRASTSRAAAWPRATAARGTSPA